mgnify:CR=1 FL=1
MRRIFLLLFFAGLFLPGYAQLWYEDFATGTTSGNATGDPGGTWSVITTPSGGAGSFRASGGRFEIDDTGSEGVWSTNTINIASAGYAVIEVSLTRLGLFLSAADYIRLYYSLDGGPDILFAERLGTVFSGSTVSGASAIVAANTVKITIRGMDNSLLGGLSFDNVTVTAAPIIYSRKSGTWTDKSSNGTWSLDSHTGDACSCVPLNTQVAIIGNGHTVTLPASQVNIGTPPTNNIAPGAVDVRATGTLQFNTNAVTLDIVKGLFRVRSGGVVNSSAAGITGEQIRFNADVGAANLQIEAGGDVSIEDFVIGPNATNSVYISGGGNLTVTDDILIGADNSTLYNSLTGTISVSDRIEFQTGVTDAGFVNNQPITAGTIYFDEDGDVFTNNATATVTTLASGSGDNDGSVINTAGATLNIGSIATAGATDILNAGTINQSGNFTSLVNTSQFINQSTGVWNWSLSPNTGFDTDINTALRCSTAGNLFNYNGSGDQSILNLNNNYYHLTASNSGNKSASTTLTVNGNLLISNAAALLPSGTVDIAGNVTIENSGVLAGSGAVNVGGNWSAVDAASYAEGTRTTTFDGANQVISNASGTEAFYILALTGSGTKSSGNVLDVNNNLTIGGSAQLNVDNDLYVAGNWTVNSSNGDPFVEGTYKVTLDGTGTQTIITNKASETFYDLDITGGGTKSNSSPINIARDLTIAGDATTSLSGTGNIDIKGNWTVTNALSTDPFVEGTRTVSFTGSNPQTLTTVLSAGETFYNLTINNTSLTIPQISFANPVTTANRLDLDRGVVNLNGHTFTLGRAATASTLDRTGGWMYNGAFKRFWPSGVRIYATGTTANYYGLFPLGHSDTNAYRPITIASTGNTTAAGSFTAQHIHVDGITEIKPSGYVESISPSIIIAVKHNARFLTSYTGVTGGGTYTITATMTGLLNGTASDIRLAINNGATVTHTGTHVAATSANNPTVGRSGVALANLNNEWRITSTNGTNTPLPVELVSFNARLNNDVVDLNWRTASELNNHFFTIERTADIERFEPIFKTDGAGTTNQPVDYAHTDTAPLYGRSYYRLKQTDFDGSSTYSKVVTVDYEGPRFASMHIYPNPLEGSLLEVVLKGLRDPTSVPVQVVDSHGMVVYAAEFDVQSAGVFQMQLKLVLKPGVYFVRSGKTFTLTQKLVVR